jgi:DNA-binding NtrC family response regulator
MIERAVIGCSPELMRVVHAARLVAPTDATILIQGEPGAGKETLAREIHALSTRWQRPFLALPSASVTADLFDGAPGGGEGPTRLHPAAGGTLYLAEVADLAPPAQARLLSYLETGRVGANGGELLSLRVVASTATDLFERVESGAFRADLYHRLNVVPFEMPPLRQRPDDVPLLLRHYGREQGRALGQRPPSFSVSAMNLLRAYTWPGNVRELRNLCERLAILLPGVSIRPENLPPEIRSPSCGPAASGFRLPASGIDLNRLEADVIRQALDLAAGNRSRAARLLGITRDTLLYRIQKHGIA